MNIILFGFKGSGKTHFGRLLAKKLNRPFFDTDDILVSLYGTSHTNKEIYEILGEKAFRLLEKKAIDTLMQMQNSIIALGGGTILDPDNLNNLQKIGKLVYLEVRYETIESRKLSTALGPLKPLYETRKPLYESIPAKKISVDLLDETHVIEILSSYALQKDFSYGF